MAETLPLGKLLLAAIAVLVAALVLWMVLGRGRSDVNPTTPRRRRDATTNRRSDVGEPCVVSSECTSDFCFNGTCTAKPETVDENMSTFYSEGTICVDKHLLYLSNKGFFVVLRGWWGMRNCRDVADSCVPGYVFVLTKEDVVLARMNSDERHTISKALLSFPDQEGSADAPVSKKEDAKGDEERRTRTCRSKNKIVQIFWLKSSLCCLSSCGKIYRGMTATQTTDTVSSSRRSSCRWEAIDFIYGRDISDECVERVVCWCSNIPNGLNGHGSPSEPSEEAGKDVLWLIGKKRTLKYDPRTKKWKESATEAGAVMYSGREGLSARVDSGKLSVVRDGSEVMAIRDVRDAVFENPTSLIVITESHEIKRISLYADGDEMEYSTHPIPVDISGESLSLRTTRSGVWLLSDSGCLTT